MMEIWVRSIARAGGVEVPASMRVLEREKRSSAGRGPGPGLSGLLRRAGNRLIGFAERLERRPDRPATCA